MANKIPDFSPTIVDLNRSKMTVTIQMDKSAMSTIAHRTEDYKSIPNKLRPAMEGIADYVRQDMIPRTFQREGPGWQHLARRTQSERKAAGYNPKHPILQRTRDLYRELTDKSHPKHIEIIKVGKYARVEIGGSSSKFLENQLGRPAQRLPARPMIPGTGNVPIADRDRMRMQKIIENIYKQVVNKPK